MEKQHRLRMPRTGIVFLRHLPEEHILGRSKNDFMYIMDEGRITVCFPTQSGAPGVAARPYQRMKKTPRLYAASQGSRTRFSFVELERE
jgi:hypothetical protein